MKKTIHVNIGGMPFVLDEDAYDVLKRYLSEIEIRLDGVDDQETMQDIETRIADIFSGAISPRMQVVDTALVKRAMAVIGPAQEFGEPRRSMPGREQTCVRNDEKHLYRSRRDRVVGGVCGGIAEDSSLDATLLRVLMALFIVFGVGLLGWIWSCGSSFRTSRARTSQTNGGGSDMGEMNIDNIRAQMRKGILEYCILSIISRNDAYASSIIAELKAAEMIVVEGTLYPLLTRQKYQGLLAYRWEESPQGPPRKYYSITEKGASV